MEAIRVVIADDNEIVRTGLTVVLETMDQVELVGEAQNGLEAVDLCIELAPDVVLMDIVMPQMDGIEATQVIHLFNPGIKIVVFSALPRPSLVQHALQAGASRFIYKYGEVAGFANVLRSVFP